MYMIVVNTDIYWTFKQNIYGQNVFTWMDSFFFFFCFCSVSLQHTMEIFFNGIFIQIFRTK